MSLNNFDDQISWGNFNKRSDRPSGEDEDANITINFPYSYSLGRNKSAVTVDSADINIATDANECWVVSSQMTTELLKHEQGHYDITAIGARDFYNKMITLTAKTANDLKALIVAENGKVQRKINDANTRYDSQSNHSQNKTKQALWDQKLDSVKKNANGTIDDLPG